LVRAETAVHTILSRQNRAILRIVALAVCSMHDEKSFEVSIRFT